MALDLVLHCEKQMKSARYKGKIALQVFVFSKIITCHILTGHAVKCYYNTIEFYVVLVLFVLKHFLLNCKTDIKVFSFGHLVML